MFSRRVCYLSQKKIHHIDFPTTKKTAIYISEAGDAFFFRKKNKKNNTIVVQYLFVQVLGGGVTNPKPLGLCQSFWTPFGAMAGLKQAEKWRVRGGATESFQSFQWRGVAEAGKFPSWDGLFFLPYRNAGDWKGAS